MVSRISSAQAHIAQIHELQQKLQKLDDFAKWPRDELVRQLKSRQRPAPLPRRGKSQTNPLVRAMSPSEDAKLIQLQQELGPWPDGLDALWREIEELKAYKQLRTNAAFKRLVATATWKGGFKNAARFTDLRARFWLLEATASALLTFHQFTEVGQKPGRPSKRDFDRAIRAVDQLEACLKKGVPVLDALPIVPFRWSATGNYLGDMRKSLEKASRASKTRYSGRNALGRHSVRTFARWLHFRFRDVPFALVRRFAPLAAYESGALKRHVTQWRKEFDTQDMQKALRSVGYKQASKRT